jgi:hypothetical protein
VAFHPSLPLLASASVDGTVRIWRVGDAGSVQSSDQPLATLSGHNGPVLSVAFHPSLPLLASASGGHTVRIWRVGDAGSVQSSDQPLATLSGHERPVLSAAFHPSLPLLASASGGHTVRIWRLETATQQGGLLGTALFGSKPAKRAEEKTVLRCAMEVLSVAWQSRDGVSRLAVGGQHGSELALWQVADDALARGAEPVLAWQHVGNGLVQVYEAGKPDHWILKRLDGQPWRTLRRNGRTLPADPLLYDWLRYREEGTLNRRVPFEVAEYLQFEDGKRIVYAPKRIVIGETPVIADVSAKKPGIA